MIVSCFPRWFETSGFPELLGFKPNNKFAEADSLQATADRFRTERRVLRVIGFIQLYRGDVICESQL